MTSPAVLLAALRFYADAWDKTESITMRVHNPNWPTIDLLSDKGERARSAIAAFEAEQKERQ